MPIDLRSDTVTRPTPAMRDAMHHAPVGDDVLGDDPGVEALEAHVAQLLGKASAMLTPSGTMANQCAIRAQTQPGDEILTHEGSHIIHYEGGGPAIISGCMIAPLSGLHGRFSAQQVREAVRVDNVHYPRSSLLVIENTHNRGGGSCWPMHELRSVSSAAREAGLRVHIDGARLWNASVALGVSPRDIAACADSVSVCLSKGLGAPVGSVLAGDEATISRARRVRKVLGGGMRQAGMLAAGGMHALHHHVQRLTIDHAHAKLLARAIARNPALLLSEQHELNAAGEREPQTNIVLFALRTALAPAVCEQLREHDVLALPTGPRSVRLVTHLDVTREQIERVCEVMRTIG
jgi:threonine aldolase